MAVLADYRTDVNNLLATAVDTSTWPTTIVDQALRMAVDEVNDLLVYETNFTVISAAYQQDLSTIPGIRSVLAVAYPWIDGSEFGRCVVAWRYVGVNLIYLAHVQPSVGEVLRVRYSRAHTISGLDAAVATTVPDNNRALVGLWAAAFACDLRIRQVSENPALPVEAAKVLAGVATGFRKRASETISHIPPLGRLQWGSIGLS